MKAELLFYKQIMEYVMSTPSITRVEVIDHEGRSFSKWYDYPVYVKESFQDGGRTLKIFVTKVEV